MALQRAPEIAVVVPSHDRPVRLRFLLNALEEQTLEQGRWEVVVGHDSAGPETEELLRTHPLAAAGVLRHVTLPSATAPPGANRNAAWRLTRAPVIAFTDDDCRPPPEWLERALTAATMHAGSIVQGATLPDPTEDHLLSPYRRSQRIDPPTAFAQACNIVYPRELLERLGGFDEEMHLGEDADLALRARKAGAGYVGAKELLTYHAVTNPFLMDHLRGLRRWGDLPQLIARHPEHRREYPLRMFRDRAHALFALALLGAALSRHRQRYWALAIPWAGYAVPPHGPTPLGRLRAAFHMPGRALSQAVEMAVIARGSVKYRTPFL
jgi:glycosyltransferase involved in cell wall biosynthesis